jgi:hypothetical protein
MFGIQILSLYLMAVGLLAILVIVLIWQKQRTGKTVAVWAASGAVGILLGCVAPMAIAPLVGFNVQVTHRLPPMAGTDAGAQTPDSSMAMPGGPGMPGMGGGSEMGGMGGMGGMMGMGGPRQPRPKRDLTVLVRKIGLLTGDVAITLSNEQAASLCQCLAELEKAETMSDDDAKAKHEAILAILDEDQKALLDAVDLPRRRPGGSGGGPGGPGGGPGGPGGPGAGASGPGGGPGGPGGGPGGPGGGEQDPNANPFHEEANAAALDTLRNRFAPGEKPADTAAPEKSPEK